MTRIECICKTLSLNDRTFKKQGCHPFYTSIFDDIEYYEDMQSVDYSNVIGVQYNESASSLSANILRTAKLEEMLTQVSMSLHMYLNVHLNYWADP